MCRNRIRPPGRQRHRRRQSGRRQTVALGRLGHCFRQISPTRQWCLGVYAQRTADQCGPRQRSPHAYRPWGSVPIFFGRVFNVFDFQPVQAATVVRLDGDICIVVDRSSSMKLYLTETGRPDVDQRPAVLPAAQHVTKPLGASRSASTASSTRSTPRPRVNTSGWSLRHDYSALSLTQQRLRHQLPLERRHSAVTSAMSTLSDQKIERPDRHRSQHHQRNPGATEPNARPSREDDGPDESRGVQPSQVPSGRRPAAARTPPSTRSPTVKPTPSDEGHLGRHRRQQRRRP